MRAEEPNTVTSTIFLNTAITMANKRQMPILYITSPFTRKK